MRRSIIISTACLLFAACNKDNNASLREKFAGIWEFERAFGYSYSDSAAPGNGRIIYLGRDGVFERRSRDSVTYKGAYTLRVKKDCYGSDRKVFIKTSDATSQYDELVIAIEGDKLFLGTSNCLADGGVTYYRRK